MQGTGTGLPSSSNATKVRKAEAVCPNMSGVLWEERCRSEMTASFMLTATSSSDQKERRGVGNQLRPGFIIRAPDWR